MSIIGWIRQGDKASCGGTVIEGYLTSTSHGRACTFKGAKMACRKNCVVVEAYPFFTLPNGQPVPHHGHKTSGNCPLESTLNGIDGLDNESGGGADGGGGEIPVRFVQNEDGEWVGKMNEGYDQHFVLTDEETGQALVNRYYRMTCNGKVTEGRTDASGKTKKVSSDDPAEVTIEIMPEGYAGADT